MELLKRITLLLLVAVASYGQWSIPSGSGTGGYLALTDSLSVAGPIRITGTGKLYFPDGTYMSTATLGTASSITDSLDKYRTAYKLDTTAIDTAQYGKFVRDHQTSASGDIAGVSVQAPIQGGGITGTVTIGLDTTTSDASAATRYWVKSQGYNATSADITAVTVSSPLQGGGATGAVTISADTTLLATKYYVDSQTGSGSGDIEGVNVQSPVQGGGATGTVTISVDTTLLATQYYVDTQMAGAGAGDITSVAAGDAMLGGGTTGAVTLSADTSKLATQYYVGSQSFLTAETGDIQSVTAGDALSGGGITGDLTIDIKLSQIGALETSGDSLRLKLDGTSLSKSSSGLAVSSTYTSSVASTASGLIADSLNKYRTDYLIDTTAIDDTQWEAYIQGHQTAGIGSSLTLPGTGTTTDGSIYWDSTEDYMVIGDGSGYKIFIDSQLIASNLSTAITDSLAKYTTTYKLDTTKIDTSMWGAYVRDHQSTFNIANNSITYSKIDTSAFQYIDVRKFGAAGDGVTDDTDAIQDAIDYVNANSGNRMSVYIPGGKYLLRDTGSGYALKIYQGIRIVGSGIDENNNGSSTQLYLDDGQNCIMMINDIYEDKYLLGSSGNPNGYSHWFSVENIAFKCNGANNDTANAIAIRGTGENAIFKNISIYDYKGTAIFCENAAPVTFENINIYPYILASVTQRTGFDLSVGNYRLIAVGGDDNTPFIKVSNTGNFSIFGIKAEHGTSQPDSVNGSPFVLCDSLYLGMVNIYGGTSTLWNGSPPRGEFIKIQKAVPTINLTGIYAQGYTDIIVDTNSGDSLKFNYNYIGTLQYGPNASNFYSSPIILDYNDGGLSFIDEYGNTKSVLSYKNDTQLHITAPKQAIVFEDSTGADIVEINQLGMQAKTTAPRIMFIDSNTPTKQVRIDADEANLKFGVYDGATSWKSPIIISNTAVDSQIVINSGGGITINNGLTRIDSVSISGNLVVDDSTRIEKTLLVKGRTTFNNNIALSDSGTYWDDLLGPIYLGKQTAGGKPDFSLDSLAYFFPQNDSTEFILMRMQIPHRWKEGSTIYPHVHWVQNQNKTPVFRIWYQWSDNGEVLPAWSFVDAGTNVFSYTSGKLQQISKTASGISGSGHTGVSGILLIKLKRWDNDYVGDCLVTDFDVHIECDALGSNTEYSH